MRVTDSFILPEDVVLQPLSSFSPEQREQLQGSDDDVVITRARSRTMSKVIDADLARLLAQFREGSTIVAAVVAFANENARDPEATLDGAFPVLEKLIGAKLLSPLNSEGAKAVESTIEIGSKWADFVIERSVAVLEDTEIHQATNGSSGTAALKIARADEAGGMASMFTREAKILEYIGGTVAPRLLSKGNFQKREYLAIEWCDGVDASRAAARWRSNYSRHGRQQLLHLASGIANAYAELHAIGVVHGDVHPGNIIVSEHGSIKLIDFGLSIVKSSDDDTLKSCERGAARFFFEPEYAAGYLSRPRKVPQASFAGEQHVLAHVLYQLFTGHGFARFASERAECMRQLSESEAVPFASWGVDPWPDVERALTRALSRSASDRFESVADLAHALACADVPDMTPRAIAPPRHTVSELSHKLLDDYVGRFDPNGALFDHGVDVPPHSSVNYGTAGIALFLYRLSLIRCDATLLSWAKAWIELAIDEIGKKGELAFTDNDELRRDVIGPVALYHTETGLFATKALIAHAMSDLPGQIDGVSRFVKAASQPCDNIDLTLGSSGTLLGAALLHDAMPNMDGLPQFGESLFHTLSEELAAKPPIAISQSFHSLGIAHGWSGVLYAMLRWCHCRGIKPPAEIAVRLSELAALAEPDRNGVRWTRHVRQPDSPDGNGADRSWCNGTGGHIHLWTLAHEVYGDESWLKLAEGSAWNVIGTPEHIHILCCGRSGQTYGLLNLYKHTGDERWLGYAKQLAEESLQMAESYSGPGSVRYHNALYKGPMGAALISAEFENPEQSAMPLFEREGWR